MRDYLKVQHRFARIAAEDMAARDRVREVRPEYYSAMLERMATDIVKGTSPVHCDKVIIQVLLEQIGAFCDPGTQLLLRGRTAWQPMDPGFRVRRHGDTLIVTEAAQDHRFAPGDVITRVQNNTIPEYHRQVWRTLRAKTPENEDWLIALQFSATVHVLRPGGEVRLPLLRFPFAAPVFRTELSFRDGVGLLRLDSLTDVEGIRELLLQNAGALRQSRGVILDLRRCTSCGGCDALLPLLADGAARRSALVPPEEVWLLCTQENKRLLRGELMSLRASAESDEDRREMEGLLQELGSAEGWVPVRPGEAEDPAPAPIPCRRLIVLSDRETGADAERFIEALRRLGRGTVVGRHTLGALDYTHPLARALDSSLTLVYSCGMRAAAFHGEKINETGLAPDVHIPWSPAFLTEDPDLDAALAML